MSFIHCDSIKKLLISGKDIDFSIILKVGDMVDSETVSFLINSTLNESSELIQKSDVFSFAENDLGERYPCYITFSKVKGLWVFRGACFEDSIINRCGGFQYVSQTIGDYCVEKFNTAYIKAITQMYSNSNSITGKDIYDYINFDALTAAGYLISLYGDKVLHVFEEKGAVLCREELLEAVSELLKHKDDIYEEDGLTYIK